MSGTGDLNQKLSISVISHSMSYFREASIDQADKFIVILSLR